MDNLTELLKLPLHRKIHISTARIVEFYNKTGGKCYISISGGKDSTVLWDLARKIYPDIKGVFCNTGLEYPEIVEFVKSLPGDIEIIRPKMGFKDVLEKYGYPVLSKEISQTVREYRSGQKHAIRKFSGEQTHNGKKSPYNLEKYFWVTKAPFKISDQCCDKMKKEPFHKYEKDNSVFPIIGTLASESNLRKSIYKRYGCNSFIGKRPISRPLSLWTEQDVLFYIRQSGIKICSVYGEIKSDEKGKHTLTGCTRTGCLFCMLGIKNDLDRFKKLEQTHKQMHDYCMENLGLKEVISYIIKGLEGMKGTKAEAKARKYQGEK